VQRERAVLLDVGVLVAHLLQVGPDHGCAAEAHADVGVLALLLDLCENLVPVGPAVPHPDVLQPVGRVGLAHLLHLALGTTRYCVKKGREQNIRERAQQLFSDCAAIVQ
jgi:hypothetical protein